MNYPFTIDQFFQVFVEYNQSVWPMQLIFYVIAILIVYLLFKKLVIKNKIILCALAFFWLWMGIVYQWLFFSSINPAAKFFGAIFLLQGIFLGYEAIRDKIDFSFSGKLRSYFGLFFLIFGSLLYPILGYILGHKYPATPTFGLPCPTTIFTIGMFLFIRKLPKYLMVIPFVWALIGSVAAFSFGVIQDYLLFFTGIVGIFFTFFKKENSS